MRPDGRAALVGAVAVSLLFACVPAPAVPTPTSVATAAAAKPTAAVPASPAVAASPAAVAASPAAAASPAVSPAAKPAASPAASPATVVASPSPVALPTPGPAPKPAAAGTFGFGRLATADDIKKVDIEVRPDGAGLPVGSGTAVQGRPIYAQKCASCHGANGEGGGAPKLVDPTPFKPGVTATVGNYWPYATTVWDYINRAMPFDKPGSLSADEVYALTAFLLSENKIVNESDVMDARSLPRVKMPNASGFVSPDSRPDVH